MEKTRARLVLVEDDADSLEALSLILGERYSVFAYGSPLDAVAAVDTVAPDVLVLDIGLQPVDGVECLKRIRSIPSRRDVPAVALTGFARATERRAFLDAGFQAVLVKPILDYDAAMAVIDAVLDGRAPAAIGNGPPASPAQTGVLAAPHATTRPLDPRGGFAPSSSGGSTESGPA